MGVTVADVHSVFHGDSTPTTHARSFRLHFGDEGIDETNGMPETAYRALIGHRVNDERDDFDDAVEAWMAATATQDALDQQVEFNDAMWAAL